MKHTHNGLFFIIDEHNSHNGITDRLKAAVGLYYIAKCNGADYHQPQEGNEENPELNKRATPPRKRRRVFMKAVPRSF